VGISRPLLLAISKNLNLVFEEANCDINKFKPLFRNADFTTFYVREYHSQIYSGAGYGEYSHYARSGFSWILFPRTILELLWLSHVRISR